MKEGGYINILLTFLFDFLGHSRGRPVDASKHKIADYQLNIYKLQSPELLDVVSLMIHIYYLSLCFTLFLMKVWFNDCKK